MGHDRGVGKRRVDVTMIAVPDRSDVVFDSGIDLGRAILHRLLGIGDGREDVVIDLNSLGGILRLIA